MTKRKVSYSKWSLLPQLELHVRRVNLLLPPPGNGQLRWFKSYPPKHVSSYFSPVTWTFLFDSNILWKPQFIVLNCPGQFYNRLLYFKYCLLMPFIQFMLGGEEQTTLNKQIFLSLCIYSKRALISEKKKMEGDINTLLSFSSVKSCDLLFLTCFYFFTTTTAERKGQLIRHPASNIEACAISLGVHSRQTS